MLRVEQLAALLNAGLEVVLVALLGGSLVELPALRRGLHSARADRLAVIGQSSRGPLAKVVELERLCHGLDCSGREYHGRAARALGPYALQRRLECDDGVLGADPLGRVHRDELPQQRGHRLVGREAGAHVVEYAESRLILRRLQHLALDRLVDHHPGGPDIGCDCVVATGHNLRGHVGGRSHARRVQGGRGLALLLVHTAPLLRLGRRQHLRQREVSQDGLEPISDHDVVGLEVAVDAVVGVQEIERLHQVEGH
mmetsp:Transcript_16897/g.43189  ORF Transcript_16897/g.43189 Transcript_16897/m.43189 type:complete len:255 (-) Transcript_16897:419-1183(-)